MVSAGCKQNVTNKKTKNNTDKNFMVAKADTMKFEAINNKIILEKNAIIEQNNRILTSELLYYDLKQEIAYMPKVNNQRSKIIL
jgi:lipopolysaccharide export system protein LptA